MKNKVSAAFAIALFCTIGFAGPANAQSYGPFVEQQECLQAADDYDTQQRIDEGEGGGSGGGSAEGGGDRGMSESGYAEYYADEGTGGLSRCYRDTDGLWYFTL